MADREVVDASFPRDGDPYFEAPDDGARLGRLGDYEGPVRCFVVRQALDDGTPGISGIMWSGIRENVIGFEERPGAERVAAGWREQFRGGIAKGSSGDAMLDWWWKKGVEAYVTFEVGPIRTAPSLEAAVQDAVADPFGS